MVEKMTPSGVLVRLEKPFMVHPIGFIMLQPTMEKLLNIEQFFHWKFI
jgi:hypothetical protein